MGVIKYYQVGFAPLQAARLWASDVEVSRQMQFDRAAGPSAYFCAVFLVYLLFGDYACSKGAK